MASSVVKSVLEIGSYEEELVRAVIQNRLEELGKNCVFTSYISFHVQVWLGCFKTEWKVWVLSFTGS